MADDRWRDGPRSHRPRDERRDFRRDDEGRSEAGRRGGYGVGPDYSEYRGDYGRRGRGGPGGYPGRDMDEGRGSSDRGRRDRSSAYEPRERGFLERAADEVSSWFGEDPARRHPDDLRDRPGPYRGRGPKGYRRSDERILEDLNDRLTEDAHIDASDVEVSVSKGEAILSGTVNSRFEKRHAEDIAESVSGVAHVQNNLRVRQGGSGSGSAGSTGAGSGGGSP